MGQRVRWVRESDGSESQMGHRVRWVRVTWVTESNGSESQMDHRVRWFRSSIIYACTVKGSGELVDYRS